MDKEEMINEEVNVNEQVINPELEAKIKANEEKFGPAKWYALHTFSGYENVAKENLETVVTKFNLEDRIFDIIIPMESVVEEKKGKKVLVQRKAMPSYILVKMKYADDIWHNVTRTRGITGFVGPKGRPLELQEHEIMAMRLEAPKLDVTIKPTDVVEILGGPFDKKTATVISVDTEQQKAKVNVEMFGRETPIDVNLDQIRKI